MNVLLYNENRKRAMILPGHYTEDSDWGDNTLRTEWVKSTKQIERLFRLYKLNNECDYDRRQYDCTGTSRVTVKIQYRTYRKRNKQG